MSTGPKYQLIQRRRSSVAHATVDVAAAISLCGQWLDENGATFVRLGEVPLCKRCDKALGRLQ